MNLQDDQFHLLSSSEGFMPEGFSMAQIPEKEIIKQESLLGNPGARLTLFIGTICSLVTMASVPSQVSAPKALVIYEPHSLLPQYHTLRPKLSPHETLGDTLRLSPKHSVLTFPLKILWFLIIQFTNSQPINHNDSFLIFFFLSLLRIWVCCNNIDKMWIHYNCTSWFFLVFWTHFCKLLPDSETEHYL